VNGAAQNITFNSTGGWTTWNNLDVVVPLNSGSNTIRLESTGQDLANIDQLTLP
jgi:rhamnogalacturonan endolyase